MRKLTLSGLALTVLGGAPILSLALALLLSDLFGCPGNEASAEVCKIGGVDLGPALTHMAVIGWLGILTWPIAVLGLSLLLLVLVLRIADRSKAR